MLKAKISSLRRLAAAPGLALAVSLSFAAPAQAAPQALALIASNGPVPLTCRGAECWAEFSAFCLQPGRPSPIPGTAYELAETDQLRVIGQTEDGRKITLDPARDLKIEALRTHVAVRLSLPYWRYFKLGLASVSVEVGQNVSLLPVPVDGDETPLNKYEIATATGVLRELGSSLVDRNRRQMSAVRLTSRLINALEPKTRVSREVRQSLWRTVIAEKAADGVPESGRALARQTFETCLERVRFGGHPNIRQCLESRHDAMVGPLNTTYWDAVRTGS